MEENGQRLAIFDAAGQSRFDAVAWLWPDGLSHTTYGIRLLDYRLISKPMPLERGQIIVSMYSKRVCAGAANTLRHFETDQRTG